MNRHFRVTKDGSPTLFVPELDEHYHSIHGALQESRHVFIEAGLKFLVEKGYKEIRVFEVGLGTGLNAFLSWQFADENEIKIYYDSIEPYPLETEEYKAISTALSQQIPGALNQLNHLHIAAWKTFSELSPNFSLMKRKIKLKAFQSDQKFDLIFFDAFAPSAQPQLWEQEVFEKMYQILDQQGVLVTYCAKGAVKRAMKASGFKVDAIPGPPGKREMTRALKNL